MEARGASDSDREEAMGLTLDKVRFALEEIDSSLVGTDVDQFGALAVRRKLVVVAVLCLSTRTFLPTPTSPFMFQYGHKHPGKMLQYRQHDRAGRDRSSWAGTPNTKAKLSGLPSQQVERAAHQRNSSLISVMHPPRPFFIICFSY